MAEMGDLTGRRVLLVGCGTSTKQPREMATRGAHVWCMDISPGSVERFMKYPFGELRERIHPVVGDAENMPFEENYFDVITGRAVVHHLDIEKFVTEVRRVCRRGALFVVTEPLGINPVINLFRWLTPSSRVPTEHPFRRHDIEKIRRHCESLRLRFNFLLSIAAAPWFLVGLHRLGRWAFRAGNALDRLLFRICPPAKWLAWNVTLVGRLNPQKQAGRTPQDQ